MRSIKALIVAIALATGGVTTLSGCFGAAEVSVESPRLVWVADGIWVVEDYPYAVYYYDNYYWRLIDGVWYRSTWYSDGFVRVGVTPRPLIRIHRPRRYIHYRPAPGVRTRPAQRTRPNVRDRRRRR